MAGIVGLEKQDTKPKRWETRQDCVNYVRTQIRLTKEARDTMDLLSVSSKATHGQVQQLYHRFLLKLGATLNAIACAYCAKQIDEDTFFAWRKEVIEAAAVKTTRLTPGQAKAVRDIKGTPR